MNIVICIVLFFYSFTTLLYAMEQNFTFEQSSADIQRNIASYVIEKSCYEERLYNLFTRMGPKKSNYLSCNKRWSIIAYQSEKCYKELYPKVAQIISYNQWLQCPLQSRLPIKKIVNEKRKGYFTQKYLDRHRTIVLDYDKPYYYVGMKPHEIKILLTLPKDTQHKLVDEVALYIYEEYIDIKRLFDDSCYCALGLLRCDFYTIGSIIAPYIGMCSKEKYVTIMHKYGDYFSGFACNTYIQGEEFYKGPISSQVDEGCAIL